MFHIFWTIHPSPKVISAVIDIKSILSKRWRTASSFMCSRRLGNRTTGNGRFEGVENGVIPNQNGGVHQITKSSHCCGLFLSLGWSTYPTRNSLMINWWVSKIAPPCHLRVQESYSNRSSNLRSIFSPVVWLEDETFGIPWRDETWLLRIYILSELETETLISWS